VPVEPRPAASVVLVRPGAVAPVESYLIRRARGMRFLGGYYAFPGGKVDLGDRRPETLARASGLAAAAAAAVVDAPQDEVPPLAYWVAAVRELFEEVGVLLATRGGVALEGPLGPDVLALRDRLHAREGLAAVLARIDAVPATHALYAFARWVTPSVNPRRFDTRFLIGRMPGGQEPCPDGTETESCTWYTPAAAIAAYLAGEIELIPPTVRTLDDLARFASIDDALGHARTRAVVPACPEIETEAGVVTMRYPGIAGDPLLPDRRLVLEHGRWRPLAD
jgi:8-oxo-dGTP pyrophosphatase MutT (NUDIX family)